MALAITRNEMQSFMIGDDIKVTIVKINGKQAKIAIEAPKNIIILRGELYNKK